MYLSCQLFNYTLFFAQYFSILFILISTPSPCLNSFLWHSFTVFLLISSSSKLVENSVTVVTMRRCFAKRQTGLCWNTLLRCNVALQHRFLFALLCCSCQLQFSYCRLLCSTLHEMFTLSTQLFCWCFWFSQCCWHRLLSYEYNVAIAAVVAVVAFVELVKFFRLLPIAIPPRRLLSGLWLRRLKVKIARRILMKLNSSMRCCNCCSCSLQCGNVLTVMVMFLFLLLICICNNVMDASAAFAAANRQIV